MSGSFASTTHSPPPSPVLCLPVGSSTTQEPWENQYRLGACIGQGGFGVVYKALAVTTGTFVAVKQMRAGRKQMRSMQREIDLLRELDHPNIVKVRVGVVCGVCVWFVCVPYVASSNLELKVYPLSVFCFLQYIDSYRSSDQISIIIEYVAEGSLSAILQSFGRFPETVSQIYIKQVLVGLAYLHSQVR